MPKVERHILSTHSFRRSARAAQQHYKKMQAEAVAEGGGSWPPTDEPARQSVYELGIELTTPIHVGPAIRERGKWVVYWETAPKEVVS